MNLVDQNALRQDAEFYRTPAWATHALLGRVKFSNPCWEAAAGDGALADVLAEHGYEVLATDLYNYNNPGIQSGVDFLTVATTSVGSVVTNPPFSLAEQFIWKALKCATDSVGMLLRLGFLESEKRIGLWTSTPLERVLIFSRRLTMWRPDDPDRSENGQIPFAWYIWRHGYEGKPTIEWITEGPKSNAPAGITTDTATDNLPICTRSCESKTRSADSSNGLTVTPALSGPLTLTQRASLYSLQFPEYPPLRADKRWIDGVWFLGNDYRGSGYYGSYPPGYLKRTMALFPDARTILHVFSGSLPQGPYVRFDINPNLRPDIVGDAHTLSEYYTHGSFDLIFADPPYSDEDSNRYGTTMINRNRVLSECAKLLSPKGHIVWLDQVLPMYRKSELHHVGAIAIVRSTNHRFRMVSIFERA
jgi:hypothetical protein